MQRDLYSMFQDVKQDVGFIQAAFDEGNIQGILDSAGDLVNDAEALANEASIIQRDDKWK